MQPGPAREQIKVWWLPELGNIELHHGTSVVRSYPRHWHEEFHLCLIEDGAGDLRYRGATHSTPAGCLFIVHPGEVHANYARDEAGCTYRNLYVPHGLLQQIGQQVSGGRNVPFFPQPVIFGTSMLRHYLQVHRALEAAASHLEHESRMLELLVHLIGRFAEKRPAMRPVRRESRAVRTVREYLTDNYAENVSLRRLAEAVGLSPFYLNRVFSLEQGLPPHAFQTQMRVLKARDLLRQGCPLAQVACLTGFADQSHFTRRFKRLVGVPPGEYLRGAKPGLLRRSP